MKNGTFSYGTTPNSVITAALKEELGDGKYTMSLVGDENKLMTGIVNQGIDAHLEAFTESKFTSDGYRLNCEMGHKDMLVLLRRLNESGDENAMSLRMGILTTLEIEEI